MTILNRIIRFLCTPVWPMDTMFYSPIGCGAMAILCVLIVLDLIGGAK